MSDNVNRLHKRKTAGLMLFPVGCFVPLEKGAKISANLKLLIKTLKYSQVLLPEEDINKSNRRLQTPPPQKAKKPINHGLKTKFCEKIEKKE